MTPTKRATSKPAQIKPALADRCEAIARTRRQATGDNVTWSQIMAEALGLGLKTLERRKK